MFLLKATITKLTIISIRSISVSHYYIHHLGFNHPFKQRENIAYSKMEYGIEKLLSIHSKVLYSDMRYHFTKRNVSINVPCVCINVRQIFNICVKDEWPNHKIIF